MKLVMVAVFDQAAAAYGRPFFGLSRGEVIRGFADEVQRDVPDNLMARHPQDFSLHMLGEFESETAAFDLLIAPTLLVRGADFARKEPPAGGVGTLDSLS